MSLSIVQVLFAVLAIAILLFLLRILPFLIYRNKKAPAFFSFLEKYIPPISIAVLFAVCFKEKTTDLLFSQDASQVDIGALVSAFAGIAVTILFQIWKKNAMVSIFGGTIVFMTLNYFF